MEVTITRCNKFEEPIGYYARDVSELYLYADGKRETFIVIAEPFKKRKVSSISMCSVNDVDFKPDDEDIECVYDVDIRVVIRPVMFEREW